MAWVAASVVALLVVVAACSGGGDPESEGRGSSGSADATVPAEEPVGTVPAIEGPDLPESATESVAEVVERLDLDEDVEACLRVRIEDDPGALGDGRADAEQVAAGCTHLVERVVPVYVGSLDAGGDLDDESRRCLAAGLYRLSDEEVDAISASMVAPGGEGAEEARALLFDMQKECGLK